MLDYFSVAFPTGRPMWTTDNEVVYKDHAIILRCFRSGEGEPTLVLPPQAGHSSHIADYDHGQSLVATALKNTSGPVYCIEWPSATIDRKDESVDDLVDMVLTAITHIGKSHLIGLCQCGWLATIVTALYPEIVLSLMLVAAPIDFHAGGGVIYETITKLGMKPYRDVVRDNKGLMPGAMMLLGWKLMNPVDRFMGDYVDIWTDVLLGNTKKLAKVKKFRTWYEFTQDLSGVWYLQACEELFLKNQLVRGNFKVHGEFVDLSKITCPVAMIAGELDEITLQSHLFALSSYIKSSRVYVCTIPKCGHIGCFMGTKSQGHIAEALIWIHRGE